MLIGILDLIEDYNLTTIKANQSLTKKKLLSAQ